LIKHLSNLDQTRPAKLASTGPLRGEESLGGMLGRAEAERLAGLLADGSLVEVPG
jgi:hypothetical protein